MLNKNSPFDFAESIFDLYHIDKFGFFYDFDDETDDIVEIPLILDEKLTTTLGMTAEQIESMDEDAALRWWNKYPFFRLYSEFLETSQKAASVDGNRKTPLYDYEDVKQRLDKTLLDMDKFVPGTYHKGVRKLDLVIDTEYFVSFAKTKELLDSFLDICRFLEHSFFRALKKSLSNTEIQEYNFLVSALNVTDITMPTQKLTCNVIEKCREVFIQEGFTRFSSYATIRSFVSDNPWRALGFFDNKELLEELLWFVPTAKGKMRKFSMNITHFECLFTWADAEILEDIPNTSDDDLLDVLSEYQQKVVRNRMTAGVYEGNPYAIDRRPSIIYVKKTPNELAEWSPFWEPMREAVSSVSCGGLRVPKTEISRLVSRFNAIQGGNSNE